MNELDCDHVVRVVTDFLEDSLDAEAERDVVHHLSECEGCTTYLTQIQVTTTTLGKLPSPTLPSPIRHTLLTAYRKSR